MPAIARVTDLCTGHGLCGPRPADSGRPSVLANGLQVHCVGDHWSIHCMHDSFLLTGSSTVLINGVGVGRVGDQVECGSSVMTGSHNILIG
jgi:uncharacterized Zn-binding protein involved in type VI secretion